MKQDIQQNKPYHFEETQRLNHWLIWTVTLGILFFFVSVLVYQLMSGNQFGDKPAPNGLLICVIFILLIPSVLLLRYAILTVRFDDTTIYYGWNLPTNELNRVNFSEIASCEIITYRFVGYGYRLSLKYGVVYNTSGNKGLWIITKTGEKILLGTHKAAEMAEALNKLGVTIKQSVQ